jgi:hypothetical protein
VLEWFRSDPLNWVKTRQLIEDKYGRKTNFHPGKCGNGKFNVDAKLNGAYVALGILYAKGDPMNTIEIPSHCAEEYCNPGSAAGPIFTSIPFIKLPSCFTDNLDQKALIVRSGAVTLEKLFAITEKIARQAVVKMGGGIEKDDSGEEVFVIPVQAPQPGVLEQSWEARPIANSRFTEVELVEIKNVGNLDLKGEIHIPIGIPNTVDTLKTFVDAEGSFSPGCGSYGVYFWVFDPAEGKLVAPTMPSMPCM